jgi:GTP-binding protein EngB required for normal cell division
MSITSQIAEKHSIEEILNTLLMIDSATSNQSVQTRLLALQEKLAAGQLYLAVLGQMKRGKSSLINALLNAEVLPTGILPVTAIITELRYGEVPGATIIYSTGGLREQVAISSLADYISEIRNPGNKKQVGSVEISFPSSFLKDGIVIVDTPGIGSTYAHNTQTTEQYLEKIDAGIVVLSVDPPITEVESRFISDLKDGIPKLFFILNKTDAASPEGISEIVCFLENELIRLQMDSPEIFPLSALHDRNHERRPSGGAAPSGLETFEQRLQTFLVKEKHQVLVRSVAGDALEIARTLRFAHSVGARAANMTADELQEKRLSLEQIVAQSGLELRELQVLLHQRSADILAGVEYDLTAQVEAYISEVQDHLKIFRTQHAKATGRAFGALLEDFLMEEVETVFRRWKVKEDDRVQTQMNALSARFVEQANGILGRLERAAGALFEIPVEHLKVTCPLRAESHHSYKVERIFYSLDSFLLVLPGFLMRPIVLRRMHNNVPVLLDMNAGRIRYDYLERLQASMHRFEGDLRGAISMVIESLQAALRAPSSSLEQHTTTVNSLDAVIRDCWCLCSEP